MTMALKDCSASNQIVLDQEYASKIRARRDALAEDQETCIGFLPEAIPSLQETYRYLLQTFLPQRYPRLFVIDRTARTVHNKILDEVWPLDPPDDIERLQIILATTLEDDLMILLPDEREDSPNKGKYRQMAFMTAFPAGFSARAKLGLALKDIHKPVPLYQERLEQSMDRYFARLPVGKYALRFNWSISTTGKLFSPAGHHMYAEEEPNMQKTDDCITREQASESYLRVERQVLRRLEETEALLFSVKTYLYPVSAIKAEGNGAALATAIDGLPPSLGFYKARSRWGKPLQAYLREQ